MPSEFTYLFRRSRSCALQKNKEERYPIVCIVQCNRDLCDAAEKTKFQHVRLSFHRSPWINSLVVVVRVCVCVQDISGHRFIVQVDKR